MIQLDLQSRLPIYEQLVKKLSELVLLGILAPEAQLPTVRKLAADLGVNPNTVQKAYQELERQGIIYSMAGRGSFVSPGRSAGEILLGKQLESLKKDMDYVCQAGVPKQTLIDMVEEIYGGNIHD